MNQPKIHFTYDGVKTLCGAEYIVKRPDTLRMADEITLANCGNCTRKFTMHSLGAPVARNGAREIEKRKMQAEKIRRQCLDKNTGRTIPKA